jgi:DNA-binding MarR family transcriptional regulator
MEKRGLVTREECESDARGSMVRLTAAGRAAVEAAAPDHVDAVRTYLLDKLTLEEQDILTTLLDRIRTDLPSADICRPDAADCDAPCPEGASEAAPATG